MSCGPLEKLRMIRAAGARAKYAREDLGLTQTELAAQAAVDVHCISNLERGVGLPSGIELVGLCPVLGMSADFLLFGRSG